MRRILSSLTLFIYTILSVLTPFVGAQGAPTGDATSAPFALEFPTTMRANEAFDVTVKALNIDGSVNTTYEGSIWFEVDQTPSGTKFPANLDPDSGAQSYKFSIGDQGVVTFQDGFVFPTAGEYNITVLEEQNPDKEATKKITIVPGSTSPTPSSDVIITDPVAQTTVSTSTISVSGTSKPTSTLNFYVNNAKNSTGQTTADGAFAGTVSGLVAGPNTIKVEVIDGQAKPIGSAEVTVTYSLDAPKITSLEVKEGNQVFVGATINLVAVGDPGLKTVVVNFGNNDVVLEEDINRPGTYTGTTQVTAFEGEVKPVVNVESFKGTKASFPDLVNVNIVTAVFENVKVDPLKTPKKVHFTFSVQPDLEEIKYFKIQYGTTSGVYDKNVITYEKSKIKEGEQYSWYIPELTSGVYFATITGLDADKKELPVNSGEQTFEILTSASVCFIDKVSGVKIQKFPAYSVLTWDKLEDAATYQIFKKDASGEYTMLDEVDTNTYKINIDMTLEEEVFEDFQIRATCENGEISGEGAYSESVAVQTGPAAIVFMMLLIASGTAFILMRRGYLR